MIGHYARRHASWPLLLLISVVGCAHLSHTLAQPTSGPAQATQTPTFNSVVQWGSWVGFGAGANTVSQFSLPPTPLNVYDPSFSTGSPLPSDGETYVLGTNGMLNIIVVGWPSTLNSTSQSSTSGNSSVRKNQWFAYGLLMNELDFTQSVSLVTPLDISNLVPEALLINEIVDINVYLVTAIAAVVRGPVTKEMTTFSVYTWFFPVPLSTSTAYDLLILGRWYNDTVAVTSATKLDFTLTGEYGSGVTLSCGSLNCYASSQNDDSSSTIYSWGTSGTEISPTQSTTIKLPAPLLVSSSETSFVITSGMVFATGTNTNLRFGIPNDTVILNFDSHTAFMDTFLPASVSQMSCGVSHCIVLIQNETKIGLFGFGANDFGQLGVDPSFTSALLFNATGLESRSDIKLVKDHEIISSQYEASEIESIGTVVSTNFVLLKDGRLFAFGRNSMLQSAASFGYSMNYFGAPFAYEFSYTPVRIDTSMAPFYQSSQAASSSSSSNTAQAATGFIPIAAPNMPSVLNFAQLIAISVKCAVTQADLESARAKTNLAAKVPVQAVLSWGSPFDGDYAPGIDYAGVSHGNRTSTSQSAYPTHPLIVEFPQEINFTDVQVGQSYAMSYVTAWNGSQRSIENAFAWGKFCTSATTSGNSFLPAFPGSSVPWAGASQLPASISVNQNTSSNFDAATMPLVRGIAHASNFSCFWTQQVESSIGNYTIGNVNVTCNGQGWPGPLASDSKQTSVISNLKLKIDHSAVIFTCGVTHCAFIPGINATDFSVANSTKSVETAPGVQTVFLWTTRTATDNFNDLDQDSGAFWARSLCAVSGASDWTFNSFNFPFRPGGALKYAALGEQWTVLATSGALYGCGRSDFGQLGQQALRSFSLLAPLSSSLSALPSSPYTQLAAGRRHGLLLSSNGSIASWGDYTYGQTGKKSNLLSYSDSLLSGKRISSIACVSDTSFVVDTTGQLYAWGRNDFFNLWGNADYYNIQYSFNPIAIDISSQLRISAKISWIASSSFAKTIFARAVLDPTIDLGALTAPSNKRQSLFYKFGSDWDSIRLLSPYEPTWFSDFATFSQASMRSREVITYGSSSYSSVIAYITNNDRLFVSTFLPQLLPANPRAPWYGRSLAPDAVPIYTFSSGATSSQDSTATYVGITAYGYPALLKNGSINFVRAASAVVSGEPMDPATGLPYANIMHNVGASELDCSISLCAFVSNLRTHVVSFYPLLWSSTDASYHTSYDKFDAPSGYTVATISVLPGDSSLVIAYSPIDPSNSSMIILRTLEGVEADITGATGTKTILKFSAAYSHALALTADGLIYGCGSPTLGQLGVDPRDGGAAEEAFQASFQPLFSSFFANLSSTLNKQVKEVVATAWSSIAVVQDSSNGGSRELYVWGQSPFYEPSLTNDTVALMISSWNLTNMILTPTLVPQDRSVNLTSVFGDCMPLTRADDSRPMRANTFFAYGANMDFDTSTRDSQICTAPQPTPQSLHVCDFNTGLWVSRIVPGTTTTIVVTSPIFIEGDFILPANSTLILSVNSTVIGSSVALINVTGCATLLSPLQLQITGLETSKGKGSIIVLQSNCTQTSLSPAGLINMVKQEGCRKFEIKSDQKNDPATLSQPPRFSIIATITPLRSTCNDWWIITVSTIAGVGLLFVAAILIAYKTGLVHKILPYHGSNMT